MCVSLSWSCTQRHHIPICLSSNHIYISGWKCHTLPWTWNSYTTAHDVPCNLARVRQCSTHLSREGKGCYLRLQEETFFFSQRSEKRARKRWVRLSGCTCTASIVMWDGVLGWSPAHATVIPAVWGVAAWSAIWEAPTSLCLVVMTCLINLCKGVVLFRWNIAR